MRFAIEKMNAERVGHGVRSLEDPSTVALARERGTCFEVCVTSNYQTGVVLKLTDHPLPAMLSAGLKAGLCTDDPSISQITLSGEFEKAREVLGVSLSQLRQTILDAAQAAFLPEFERLALVDRFRESLSE